ncbi:DUF2787 family protein [Vibrio rotiferianus]|uniref:DUF2787 family protein n=1 Tax=Vibrio rotiferianus TaxID=190895 RepID=UPI0005F0A27D|nr:DUF2787 family protein [Vibrio rotiferianus]
MLKVLTSKVKWSVPESFHSFLEEQIDGSGMFLMNLRNSSYTALNGGIRPVEISLKKEEGEVWIYYVTDFTYVGYGENSDLVIGTNFDFMLSEIQTDFGRYPMVHDDDDAKEFFEIYMNNLTHYIVLELFDKIEIESC